MKYGEQMILAHGFAKKLAQQMTGRPDLVIPMPLHPAKLRERGYNQAHLLASPLAKVLHLRTEDRGQRTEDRGQGTEDRGQRTEDRGQRTEDRGQRTEGRGQRAEGRRQRTEGSTVL